MKKNLLLMALVCLCHATGSAVPANPTPYVVVLPDGDSLTLVTRGDEFASWVETLDGQIVLQDIDGFWKYATVENGDLFRLGWPPVPLMPLWLGAAHCPCPEGKMPVR